MYEQPLTLIKGFGEKKAQKLKKIGLSTFNDVLYDYPRRYVDRRHVKHVFDIENNSVGVVVCKVVRKRSKYLPKIKKDMLILDVVDGYLTGEVVFFNAKYIVGDFEEEQKYYFFGKIERSGHLFKISQPEYAPISDASFLAVVPVYNATLGITQHDLVTLHREVLRHLTGRLEDQLPEPLRKMTGLMSFESAMNSIHFPKGKEDYTEAKKRLVYEELFFLQLRLILIKRNYHKPLTQIFKVDGALANKVTTLPFSLTAAQNKVLHEIVEDVQCGYSMNRLIQGDVGSGKTIIAFLSLYLAVLNQKQGVLLAPTTLLAEQHYENFRKLFPELTCGLLTSNMTASEKKKLKAEIAEGAIQVIIGTHAILQEDVVFSAAGMVIADEQHRFGIRQRLTALQKAEKPHALIMSATPIPRTLSLIIYGDMDISIIDELPAGRKPIKTHFVSPKKVAEMEGFVKEKLVEGRQAYVVCPLIESSEASDLNAAESVATEMTQKFAPYRVGLIHGKMKPADKDAIMHAFKSGEISLLVSTTVIEVGIHVSNATMMIILNAERFGLSQLHQLRGRVGRGDEQSYCFLVSEKLSQTSKKRVETLVNSASGFEIAEKDLELRGPGEVFGLRQHGLPELRLADLVKHKSVVEEVQRHIKLILEEYNMGNRVFVELINRQNHNLEKWFTL